MKTAIKEIGKVREDEMYYDLFVRKDESKTGLYETKYCLFMNIISLKHKSGMFHFECSFKEKEYHSDFPLLAGLIIVGIRHKFRLEKKLNKKTKFLYKDEEQLREYEKIFSWIQNRKIPEDVLKRSKLDLSLVQAVEEHKYNLDFSLYTLDNCYFYVF